MSFRGIANISVDAKGRLAIPKRHRLRLEADGTEDLIVTAGPDRCLLVYSLEEWLPTERKIMSLPNTNAVNRRMQRMYVGHATEIEIDSSCRILLPSVLREYARIEKKAVMFGQGRRLELWGEELWLEKSEFYPEDLANVDEQELSPEARELSL